MKFQRQARILDLIEKNEIETQEELSEHLCSLGYNATQATVSRDIKELRLIKTLSQTTGKYKYAVPGTGIESSFSTRLRNIFKECVIHIDRAQNLVVLKTLNGMANAAAAAMDAMEIDDIVGTIAGDDTILIILRTSEDADRFCKTTGDLLK